MKHGDRVKFSTSDHLGNLAIKLIYVPPIGWEGILVKPKVLDFKLNNWYLGTEPDGKEFTFIADELEVIKK